MVPTSMRRTPPSFFCVAKRCALKEAPLEHSGILPEMAVLQSLVRVSMSLRPASAVFLASSWRRCKGRTPSNPAVEPGGKS